MKHEKIRESWERIRPDEAADARMHDAVMEYRRRYRRRGTGAVLKWAIPAVCVLLAAAILLFTGMPHVRYREGSYIVKLGSGHTLVYGTGEPADSPKFAYDYEVCGRELTAAEMLQLFPSFGRISDGDYFGGVFQIETGRMVRAEGRIGGIRIFLALAGLAPSDTVITGAPEKENTIGGVPVKTGYAVFSANSKGVRNAVFFAEFEINGTAVYAETYGDEKDGRQICQKLSDAVFAMISNNTPDIALIRFE